MQTSDSNDNSPNKFEGNSTVVNTTKSHATIIGVLVAGVVVALAGDGYLAVRANHLNDDLARTESGTQAQISKLNESTQTLLSQQQQNLASMTEQMKQDVKNANDSASVAIRRARSEALKKTEELNAKLAEEQSAVDTQLSQIKDTTASKFTEVAGNFSTVNTNVDEVKANVAATQTELAKTGADLKRAMGDMGVMSGLIATNGKDLDALRALGERNYYEFDINRKEGEHKVGDVNLALKKSDPKRNRFTLDVLADDKHVEKKDKTVNEPVQFYLAGNMQPYEIVVNRVDKDHVVGYLSTPKVKMARR